MERENARKQTLEQLHERRKQVVSLRPEHLKMDFFLSSRAAVGQLIEQKYEIKLHVRSTGKYLKCWGFIPQKPIKRACEQTPEAAGIWLTSEYPGIERRAVAVKQR